MTRTSRRVWTHEQLVEGIRAGDRRALARAISIVENRADGVQALVRELYAGTGRAVTIGVTDPHVPANDGTWRIDAHGAARTSDAAQLRVGIAALSAAYLGGTSWHALAATGRVDAREPDAIALADTLFASRPLPCCGSFF